MIWVVMVFSDMGGGGVQWCGWWWCSVIWVVVVFSDMGGV